MPEYEDEDSRTIFCANISEKVTEALLYELFLQGGPLEKISQPKDKDGKARTFAFITYAHAISVPYAINLFQGTQLFNRELTIKPRNNNNNSNTHQRVEIPPLPQQPHPPPMRNPFDIIPKLLNDGRNRFARDHETQFEQSSLRSGFNPIPTKASMQMQPQPPTRFNNQHQTNTANTLSDLEKLIALGSNMLQPNSRQPEVPKRPTYDMMFTDRNHSDRHSNKLKMTNRHSNRPHHRDEPYSRRDPPRHQQRSNNDRRRR